MVESAASPASDVTPSLLLLQGIVFSGTTREAPLSKEVKGVLFENMQPNSALQKIMESSFLGKPLTEETAEQIRQLALRYFGKDNKLIAVLVPKQDISAGTLVLSVQTAKAGEVYYSGTRWFSKNVFQRKIPLKPGESIDENRLLNDTAWMNRNPFHYTQVILSPGKVAGTSDIDLMTKERFPLRGYAGADNTGIKATQATRLFAGATWGNAFQIGDLLTFQFTTSPNYHRFSSYFVNYTCYLPWKHYMTVYGGYAKIHPDIVDFQGTGENGQATMRYAIPFKPLYSPLQHELVFGFDYKFLNSNLFFGEDDFPIVTKATALTQFLLCYMLNHKTDKHNWTVKMECYGSPWKWLPHQTNAAYGQLRPDSHVRYFYSRLAVGDIYELPYSLKLAGLARFQGATGPLLSSEQFGLGGYDTVRGYEENSFLADNAVCLGAELRYRCHPKSQENELYLLAFGDYGWGYNFDAASGFPTSQYLLSAGPGLRFRVGNYLMVRADYGFQLKAIFNDDHFGRFHLSGIVSY
jgi:hemolysin activation/secretion protein